MTAPAEFADPVAWSCRATAPYVAPPKGDLPVRSCEPYPTTPRHLGAPPLPAAP